MRLLKTGIIVILGLFLMGITYIKVQAEIKKSSYCISRKMQRKEQLVDQKYSLLYNFYTYASKEKVEVEDLGYSFCNAQKLVRIEVPRTHKSQNRVISLVSKVFSIGSTAQAEE